MQATIGRAARSGRVPNRLSTASIASPEAITDFSIERQVDALLEEVLDTTLIPEPAPAYVSARDDDQRVVITGMGLITPLGIGRIPFWENITAGRSGVGPVTLFDAHDSMSRIAAEVHNFDPRSYLDAKEARRLSRASQFAVAAARLAVADAHLTIDESNRDDIGVLLGNGSTSPPETEATARILVERGHARVSPFYITSALPNMPACQVAIQLGVHGYNTTIATACAASAQAIGEAAEVIRRGHASVMLAGGTEAPICQLTFASFNALRALSTRNDDPAAASRPFDSGRDGFVLGEGAGVLILENYVHARLRGAHIYAELVGYASTCDAYHVTAPNPHGDGAARAMQRALTYAHLGPQHIDYINAHATSTTAGDIAETYAIKRVFGEYAPLIPISATKSMIGHLTSAAGAVEAAATILALNHGLIPPTINLEHHDAECDLDYVPGIARPAPLQIAMSNSFGFGGVNGVLIFQSLPHI